jgi:hypothetical protein
MVPPIVPGKDGRRRDMHQHDIFGYGDGGEVGQAFEGCLKRATLEVCMSKHP